MGTRVYLITIHESVNECVVSFFATSKNFRNFKKSKDRKNRVKRIILFTATKLAVLVVISWLMELLNIADLLENILCAAVYSKL